MSSSNRGLVTRKWLLGSLEVKIEALVGDHLRDLGTDGEEFEVVEFFPM